MALASACGSSPRLTAALDRPAPGSPLSPSAPDILQDDEAFELAPVLYLPFRQHPPSGVEFIVRTRVPPATMADAIRREVQALDADLAVRSLRPLEQSLWFRNWRHRIFGTMFAIFAGIALVLASVGLYAVIAHSVSQRTKEIGVRLSLGATPRGILTLVFTEGMSRFAIGLVLGLGGAVAATGVLESMLVGVSAADPTDARGRFDRPRTRGRPRLRAPGPARHAGRSGDCATPRVSQSLNPSPTHTPAPKPPPHVSTGF